MNGSLRGSPAAPVQMRQLLGETGEPIEGFRLADCDLIHTANEMPMTLVGTPFLKTGVTRRAIPLIHKRLGSVDRPGDYGVGRV